MLSALEFFLFGVCLSSQLLIVLPEKAIGSEVLISGNITLGGLFPLHEHERNGKCSSAVSLEGVQYLEAMLFAVDRINADDSILPNITLGVRVFDTCRRVTTALDGVLKYFIFGISSSFNKECSSENHNAVAGVVGPLTSDESVYIAKALGVFEIPLISYSASSSELSDKSKYEYFSRTIPSDVYQAKAIVQILKKFNWTYVSIVYSDDSYGWMAFESLKQEAKNHGICIDKKGKLPIEYDKEEYQAITDKLVLDESAKIVVVFCQLVPLASFLSEIRRHDTKFKNMQFICSESMGQSLARKAVRGITAKVIYTRPLSKSSRDFNDYFLNLNPVKNRRNPWFKGYYEQTMNCSIDESNNQSVLQRKVCNPNQTLRSNKLLTKNDLFGRTTEVVDAVYAFAHALHRAQENERGDKLLNCKPLCDIGGKVLLDTIRNVSFKSFSGRWVQFNSNGDITGSGRYGIYYINSETLEGIKIGEWEGELRIDSKSLWAQKFTPVKSRCSDSCGAHKIPRGIFGKPSCCWKCEACRPNEIVYNKTSCRACEKGHVPDRHFRTCLRIQPVHYALDGNVSLFLVIPPLLLSVLGILAVGLITCILIRFNNTPLVKASGRESSYLLLIGLFLSYLFPLVCVLKPSRFTCFSQFFLDSLPHTVSYVAIVVKSNRICRIFDEKRPITRRPRFAHPRSQIFLSLGLVSFQVIVLLVLTIFDFPRAELVYFSSSETHLVCTTSRTQIMLSHLYNIILVIACTYYGFKMRHIPRNFNEAKYIAFAMYGSCVVLIIFSIVSMVAIKRSDGIHSVTLYCYRVTLMSTVLLTCFFAPKIYIILFKPEKNINRPTFDNQILLPIEKAPDEVVECRYCKRCARENGSFTGANASEGTSEEKDWRRHSF